VRWGRLTLLIFCGALCMGDAPAKPAKGGGDTQQPHAASESSKTTPVAILAYDHAYILASQTAQKEPEEKLLWLKADGWVAVFTLALTIGTGLLWWATKGAISDAREASERELRAYVMVKLRGARVVGENPEAAVQIRNRGCTPAHDVVVLWSLWVGSLKPERWEIDAANAKAGNPEDSEMVLGPGESRGANVNVKPFDANEIAAITAKTAYLYVVGRVEYVDAFGVNRHTRFCHRYQGTDTGPDAGTYGHYGNSYT
jgi:hypothetical protein